MLLQPVAQRDGELEQDGSGEGGDDGNGDNDRIEKCTRNAERLAETGKDERKFTDLRLRGGNSEKQMCISFNPISANHWLKHRFFDRRCRDEVVVHSTYRDNAFLDEGYRAVLEGYRESDPYYYEVYCLGQWGVFGRTMFDARAVQRRLAALTESGVRGRFEFEMMTDPVRKERVIRDGSIVFREEDTGEIVLYHSPEEDAAYVIGADTAGEGSDFFAAQVLDNRTGEQVAVLHSAYDEDVFAKQMYCLGV
jgi:phage terminase large subunit